MPEHLTRLLQRIDDREATVVLVGQGYVGLPVAMRASELGFRVVGYDTSDERIEALRQARSYVEDVSDDELRAALGGRLHPHVERRRPAGLRRGRGHRAHAVARRRPRPVVHRGRGRRAGRLHATRVR